MRLYNDLSDDKISEEMQIVMLQNSVRGIPELAVIQTQASGKGSAHVAQLVSEVADLAEDNKDDLQLQVPL